MRHPAWYHDPDEPTLLRWWDGYQWTDHTHPADPDSPLTTANAPPAPDSQSDGRRLRHGMHLTARDVAQQMHTSDQYRTPRRYRPLRATLDVANLLIALWLFGPIITIGVALFTLATHRTGINLSWVTLTLLLGWAITVVVAPGLLPTPR